MNIGKSKGESSCRERENGDDSTGSERPLKKARFAWQVKGKYHLKNDSSETVKSTQIATDLDKAGSSGSGSSNNIGTEQKLEILGDYLLKQDFSTLDSAITDPDKSFLKPSTSISNEKLQYPRYVSSYDNNLTNNVQNRNNDYTSSDLCFPVSMVVSENYTEEQCIARWQERQIAKGIVDNTINRVLDSWIQVPLQPEEDSSRYLALDVADFINNLPGDNSIENEGILMAISAHGLQNTSNSSNNKHVVAKNTNKPECLSSTQRSLSPSDDESHETNIIECDTDSSSNDLEMPWSYSEEPKNENDTTPFPLFPDSSSLTYPYFNDNHQNSDAVCDESDVKDNHCDFLDAAVLFAIQSKGLTTFGSDYG